MLTKLFLILLIPAVGYGMTIFVAPETAKNIDSLLGVPGLSEKITGVKSDIDGIITEIPSAQEFKSGALDIKDKVTDSLETTKTTIDSVRGGAQQIENTYNDARNVVEDLNGRVDDIKNTFDDVQNIGKSISETVNINSSDNIDNGN